MKKIENLIFSLAILIFIFGVCERFIFVQSIVKHPSINILLPQTDEFNYDVMAKDLNQEKPLNLKMSVYPAYLLFVKYMYKIFGADLSFVYFFQLLLSLASVILIYFTGKMIWSSSAAIMAGLLLLFYKMSFQFDVELLPASISQVLIISTFFFFILHKRSPKITHFTGFVLSGVLLSVMRPFMWFLVIPFIFYFFIKDKHWKRNGFIYAHVLWISMSLFLFQKFHTPESFLHKFGMMFYMANCNDYGMFVALPDIPLSVEGHVKNSIRVAYEESVDKNKINTFWISKTIELIKRDPLKILIINLRKIGLLANNFEVHNNASIYFYEKYTLLGKMMLVNFSIIFALGLTGIILSVINKRGRYALLYFVFIFIMIMTMPICSRYRLPLIPFLSLFAGYAVSQLIVFVQSRNYRRLAGYSGVVILAFALSHIPFGNLSKEKDLLYWENTEKSKIDYKENQRNLTDKYKEWDKLSIDEKITLVSALGKLNCFRMFFEASERLLPEVEKDLRLKNKLLRKRAIVYEIVFQFDKAIPIWEVLKDNPAYKGISNMKLRELSIYRTFLG